jgi:hypothetical protein
VNVKGRVKVRDPEAGGRIILKHLKEVGCDDADWIHVTQNRDHWRALINTEPAGFIKRWEFD